MASIPIIDLKNDVNDGGQKIKEAITFGCAYLTGHDIPHDIIDQFHESARSFFQLPHDKKMGFATQQYNLNNINRYRGFQPKSTKQVFDVAVSSAYFKKGVIKIEDDNEEDGFDGQAAFTMLHEENIWPSGDLRSATEKYAEAMAPIAQLLLHEISAALGHSRDYFDHDMMFPGSTSSLRLFWYPQTDRTCDRKTVCSEHEDCGVLNVLFQDLTGGLQFCLDDDDESTWIDIKPLGQHELFFNVGELLQRWSDKRCRSRLHRVLGRPDIPRFSAAFFLEPNPKAHVQVPETDDDDKKSTMPYGDYICSRLKLKP